MCLRGTGTRLYARTLQPTKQPNCSSLFRLRLLKQNCHVQPKWERPLECVGLNEQTYGTSCVSHLYIYICIQKQRLEERKQFNMSFRGKAHTKIFSERHVITNNILAACTLNLRLLYLLLLTENVILAWRLVFYVCIQILRL